MLLAITIALALCALVSAVLYFNEDLRQTTFQLVEKAKEGTSKEAEKTKVDKPEPDRKQVQEIARNQERKKREKLKESARKLRDVVKELDQTAEARAKALTQPDIWDQFAKRTAEIKTGAGVLDYLRMKSNFLNSKEGVSESIGRLNLTAGSHADAMRILALQETVADADAHKGLEGARGLLADLEKAQERIQKAAESVEAVENPGEKAKLRAHVKERTDQIDQLLAQGRSYVSDYEKFLQTGAIPPTPDLATSPPKTSEDAPPPPTDEDLEKMATAELYETVQDLTQQMDEAYKENKAAELAEWKQIPLEQAEEQVYVSPTDQGPDLKEALSQNEPTNKEAFSEFNDALDQAVSAGNRMARQAENRREQALGQPKDGSTKTAEQLREALSKGAELRAQMAQRASNAGRGKGNLQDMRGVMMQNYQNSSGQGGGGGDSSGGSMGGFDPNALGSYNSTESNPDQIRLGTSRILAQALPGRRFDAHSARKGWIFIDTWYIIGPWQLPATNSFEHAFPPESDIDLDATYEGMIRPGGKVPIQLKWRFVQSEGIRIKPPDEISGSVYYAYTEVFCESAMDVVVATASDDRSKLWINDLVVFEDAGLSGWEIDEGFRRVLLKPGYNKLLVRLENGPAAANFSVLMCPIDALQKRK